MTFQKIIPIFRFFDEKKAKEFYVEYLGFTISFEHRFDNDENSPLYFGLKLSAGVNSSNNEEEQKSS